MNRKEAKVRLTPGSPEIERQLLAIIPVSSGTWQRTRETLDFPEDVSGMRILDIGAGGSDLTAKLLEDGADAYAVDPLYKSRSDVKGKARLQLEHIQSHGDRNYYRQSLEALERFSESIKGNPDRYKIAFATNLPFPDNYFDLVFSSAAILGYLDIDYELLLKSTQEALRVTKPCGKVQLWPYDLDRIGDQNEQVTQTRNANLFKWTRWLTANQGIEFKKEQTEPRGERVTITKLK